MAGIWPRLKKTLTCEAESRRKKRSKSKSKSKSKKVKPSGLEKFVALLKGVQSKRTSSLVERTGASVSAARSLSRSAQEWTASTLARSATRRPDDCSKSSPEIVFLHCAVRPSDEARTRSSDYTECCSFAEPGFNLGCVEVESKLLQDLQSENVSEVEALVAGNVSEDSKSQPGDNSDSTMAGLSVALPVRKTGLGMKRTTSNSAFVVLVALGAFISSRFGRVGNGPLAVVLALINAAVRVWRRGKLYVMFMFSSVHFSTPLRSYLTYCSRRLSLLPRKLKVTAGARSLLEVSRSVEIELAVAEGGGSRLEIPVPPLESAPAAATKQGRGAPLSLLLAIPESSAAPAETSASSAIEPVPATVLFKDGHGASSPSRRLAKKFSSGFKKFKMMRSPSSSSPSGSLLSGSEGSFSSPSLSGTHNCTGASEPGSPTSPSLHSPAAISSPDRHCKRPFSRRLHRPKPNTPSELAEGHGNEAAVSVHATEKKPGSKRSRLCRKSSTETLDIEEITLSANDTTPMSSRPPADERPATTDTSRNVSWPVVGLLVTLLFLLVGRLPAIMATSLFLVVVSNAHHDRAHARSRGRASEAARKLHRSPPPRRHPGSPPRRY